MSIDVARLPVHVAGSGQQLFRIHRSVHSPWFFSASGTQRYDPTSAAGRGACYLAERPLGAWVEVFRTAMALEEADVHCRAITSVELDREVRLADLADRRALGAGVTAALTTGADYGPAQSLAADLQGVLDGVRWRLRHDLGGELLGVALFGPEGSQPAALWPPAVSTPLSGELVREAEDAFGYRVLPAP